MLLRQLIKTLEIPGRGRLLSSVNYCTGYVTKFNMSSNSDKTCSFKGKQDRYNGITVDSTIEPCDDGSFSEYLKESLDKWIEEKKRAIWFRVNLEQSYWIPVLTNNGFKFHNAKNDWVTLYRWLPVDQTSNIPPYAHTMLGVGAVVYNDEKDEVLVVKERYSLIAPTWKFPGGYVEPGEDIAIAVEREVMEETGIKAEFKHLLTMRHAHHFAFGCSDLYMVACLKPQSFDINKCNREITECQWMKLEEYLQHPQVHDNNRLVAKKFLEYKNHKTSVTVETVIHPTLKKPVSMFTVSKIED